MKQDKTRRRYNQLLLKSITIAILIIGSIACIFSLYSYFVAILPAISGIDKTSASLTNFQMPSIDQNIIQSSDQVKKTSTDIAESAQQMRLTANAISNNTIAVADQIRNVSQTMNKSASSIRNLSNNLSQTSITIDKTASLIPSCIDTGGIIVAGCINLGTTPVKSNLGNISSQLHAYSQIGYNLSSDLDHYSSSGTNVSARVSQITADTNGGIYGIAAQIDDISKRVNEMANQVQDAGQKVKTTLADVQNIVQQAGSRLSELKPVLQFSFIAMLAVSITIVLVGVALYMMIRMIATTGAGNN